MQFNLPPEKCKEIEEKSDVLIKRIILVIILLLLTVFLINNFGLIKEKILNIF